MHQRRGSTQHELVCAGCGRNNSDGIKFMTVLAPRGWFSPSTGGFFIIKSISILE